MKIRKIRDLRKLGRKLPPKTEKQIEVSRITATKTALTNNPMKNLEVARKNADARKGKIVSLNYLFRKNNKFGKMSKGIKKSKEYKLKMSMNKIGKKVHSEEHKKKLSEIWKKNNPMKNPEVVKKHPSLLKKGNKFGALNKKKKKKKLFKKIPYKIIKEKTKNNINSLIRRRRTPPSEEERINRIKRMITDNPMKNPEVARKNGETKRKKEEEKNYLRDKLICDLYKEGYGCRRISRFVGISETSVNRVLKINKIVKRGIRDYVGDINPKKGKTPWNFGIKTEPHTEEHKRNISLGLKRYYERRKNEKNNIN